MSEKTGISWCDSTWNPWWGCTKISEGCTHCYADTLATRYGHNVWGPKADRRFFGRKHWEEPLKWDREARAAGVRRRVFCASMADVFEDHMRPEVNAEMDEAREKLWGMIESTWNLDWLVLTKRPENIIGKLMIDNNWLYDHVGFPPNLWIGTSTENQEQADKRIPELLKIPARVRFLSCEPLLGPVDLAPWMTFAGQYEKAEWMLAHYRRSQPLDWVISGGESGAGARPLNPDWARALRDQCQSAGVAFFHKQNGGRIAKSGGRELDGQIWDQFPEVLV